MVDDIYREVSFAEYCKTCKHEKLEENCYPCCECLDHGCNVESTKPVKWSEKDRPSCRR